MGSNPIWGSDFSEFSKHLIYHVFVVSSLIYSVLFTGFSHVHLEVEHFTVLAKVTGSNSVEMLIIPRSLYFLNYLSAITSRVLESLFRGSNIVLQIFLHIMSFF